MIEMLPSTKKKKKKSIKDSVHRYPVSPLFDIFSLFFFYKVPLCYITLVNIRVNKENQQVHGSQHKMIENHLFELKTDIFSYS